MNQDFDWVMARSECSAAKVFEALKDELRADIALRDGQLELARLPWKFSIDIGSAILITKEGNRISGSVVFELDGQKIVARNSNREVIAEATLTLNREGDCRLKVNGEELNSWQFRKLILEEFLFG